MVKPRLNLLVVATTTAGYYLGSTRIEPVAAFHAIVGTALVAAGASAFNQLAERDIDGLMERTRLRPLPDGRLGARAAGWFAVALAATGLVQLALGANLLAASVALVTLLTYLLVYTPLKRRTSLATLVGGIPGALPPVIGWAAATGTLSAGAWALFAIVFLWQMPHFLAIAWLYRDDYTRAGVRVLPVVEPDGRSTAAQVVLYSAVLVPASLVPALLGLAGVAYSAGALALGAAFFVLALRFAAGRSDGAARALLVGSITYLPLVWGLLLACHSGN